MRLLKCMAAMVLAGLALAATASAATTLSVTVNPTQAGTTASPQPETFSMNTTIDNNGASPTPVPVGQTASLVQTLPQEFASQLASFGSCPETSFSGSSTAPGGSEDPTVACPANSVLGSGSLKLIAQAGPQTIVGASDKAVIVNDSTTGGLAFWATYMVLTSRISKVIHGTLSTNGAGQPVVTWDPSPVQPAGPIAVKLLEFNTTYDAGQSALQALEPFASTGCAGGSWAFSIESSFVGGSPGTETASASVGCGLAAAPPANTAPPKVEGSARAGSRLPASDGTWTGNPAPTLSRQWRLCNGAGNECSDIAGATGSSYTVQSSDVGHTIRVVVKGANASGTASATSAATAVVPSGRASIRSRRVIVSAKGRGKVWLRCSAIGPCAGRYEIDMAGRGKASGKRSGKAAGKRSGKAASKASVKKHGKTNHGKKQKGKKQKGRKVVLARGRYSVAAGKTGKLSFKLTRAGRKLLRSHDGKLGSKLKLKPEQGKWVKRGLRLRLKSA